MNLPAIGHMITTDEALILCRHYQLNYLIHRIESEQDVNSNYLFWKFDGCSGIPDEMLGLFTGLPWMEITYKCCLPHDLAYAYGDPNNEDERKMTDRKFYKDLRMIGMDKFLARVFFAAVRVGGKDHFGKSFSWGFARIELHQDKEEWHNDDFLYGGGYA